MGGRACGKARRRAPAPCSWSCEVGRGRRGRWVQATAQGSLKPRPGFRALFQVLWEAT